MVVRGSSSVGRAIAFQAIGREFEPRLPLNGNKPRLKTKKESYEEILCNHDRR